MLTEIQSSELLSDFLGALIGLNFTGEVTSFFSSLCSLTIFFVGFDNLSTSVIQSEPNFPDASKRTFLGF